MHNKTESVSEHLEELLRRSPSILAGLRIAMDNIFVFKVSIVKTVIGFALGLLWDCVDCFGIAWIAKECCCESFAQAFSPQKDFLYCFASALHGGVFDKNAVANLSRKRSVRRRIFYIVSQVLCMGGI